MKSIFLKTMTLVMIGMFVLPMRAEANDLEDFVKGLSLEAKADSDGFRYRLRSQFEVSGTKVDMVLSNVTDPADAYMILRVGELSGKSPEAVLDVYKKNRGKGWGYIAKQMGIKPGSAEFHALKSKKGGDDETVRGNKGGKGKGRK